MKLPNYFDNQAAAAAAFGVSVYEVKNAKACGCRAFRSGRIYTDALVEWFEAHPAKELLPPARKEKEEFFNRKAAVMGWDERLLLLFELRDFLVHVYDRGDITAEEYREIGGKTMPLIVALSRVWKAGIDAPGFLRDWKITEKALPKGDAKSRIC